MFNFSEESVQRVIVYLVPMLLGIICHEVAHGYAAFRFGDPTAKMLGRLTLNPIKHIDPMGVLVFVLTALMAPFAIGWAKPVPVNARYFKNPIRDMAIVSFAGPLTNFLLALLFGLAMFIIVQIPSFFQYVMQDYPVVWKVLQAGVWINIVLGWFNLMPIPPLDGSHILYGILPAPLANQYIKIGRYGMIIVIVLLATGMLWKVVGPLLNYSLNFIIQLYQVPFLVAWL